MDDRSTVISLGGQEYEMLLTTRATKEISKRYGGLENLGEKLLKTNSFENNLDEVVWLIALLCNQSIQVYNLTHKDNPKEPLTEDMVELLTTPLALSQYNEAIMNAMMKGTKRNVESEPEVKNASVG